MGLRLRDRDGESRFDFRRGSQGCGRPLSSVSSAHHHPAGMIAPHRFAVGGGERADGGAVSGLQM